MVAFNGDIVAEVDGSCVGWHIRRDPGINTDDYLSQKLSIFDGFGTSATLIGGEYLKRRVPDPKGGLSECRPAVSTSDVIGDGSKKLLWGACFACKEVTLSVHSVPSITGSEAEAIFKGRDCGRRSH